MSCESQTLRVCTVKVLREVVRPFHHPTMHSHFSSPTGLYNRGTTQDIPWDYILILHADLPVRDIHT